MDDLIKYLRKVRTSLNLEKIVRHVMHKEKIGDYIVELNTKYQLWLGLRSDGMDITPPYRPATRRIKQIEGQPYDRVTLKDTGAYYRSFRVTLMPSGDIEVEATDMKALDLERKYGDKLEGLTPQNTDKLAERLKNGIEKRVEELLQFA
jgi:hypothetical protein